MTPAMTTARTTEPTLSTFPARAVTEALAEAGLLVAQEGELPERFSAITDDSRRVRPGALFVAVHGTAHDGHDFLTAAERAGAAAAIVERRERTRLPRIVVRGGRAAAAVAAPNAPHVAVGW